MEPNATRTRDAPMDRNRIAKLEDALVDDSPIEVVSAIRGSGMQMPRFAWSPARIDLPDQVLRELLDLWWQWPAAGDLPRASASDAAMFGEVTDYLMILDVLEDGWDYRYRRYGRGIAQAAKFDMMGKRTSEITTASYIPIFFIAGYRAVISRREALYTSHHPPSCVAADEWRRLILPVVDSSGAVVRMVAGNVPGNWQFPKI